MISHEARFFNKRKRPDLNAQGNMRFVRRRATHDFRVTAWTIFAILLSPLSSFSTAVAVSTTIRDETGDMLSSDQPTQPEELLQCNQATGPAETSIQSVIENNPTCGNQQSSSTTLLTNSLATSATNSSSSNSSIISSSVDTVNVQVSASPNGKKKTRRQQFRHKRGSTHEESILEDIKTLFSSNINELDGSFYDDISNASSFGNSSEIISLGDDADDGTIAISSALDKRSLGTDNDPQEILSETLMGALTEELEKQDSKETQGIAVLKKTLKNNLSPGKYFPALVVMVPYSPPGTNQSNPPQPEPPDPPAVAREQVAPLATTLGIVPSETPTNVSQPLKNASKKDQAAPNIVPVLLPDPNQDILAHEAIAGRNKDGNIHRRGAFTPPEVDYVTNSRQQRSKESQGKQAPVDWFVPTISYDGWAVEANNRDKHGSEPHCRCGRCRDLMKALEEKQRAEIALLMKKFQRYTEKLLASQSRERKFVVGNLVGECNEDDVMEAARVSNVPGSAMQGSMQRSHQLSIPNMPNAADLLSSLVSSSLARETHKQPAVVSLAMGQKPSQLSKPHPIAPQPVTSKTVTMMYVLASDVRTSSEHAFPARVPPLPKVSHGEEIRQAHGSPQEQSVHQYRHDSAGKMVESVPAEAHPVPRMNMAPVAMEIPVEAGGGSHQQEVHSYPAPQIQQQQMPSKPHQQIMMPMPVPMPMPMVPDERLNPAEAFHVNIQQPHTEPPSEHAEAAEPAKKKKKRRKTSTGSKTKRKDGKRAKRQILRKKKNAASKKKGSESTSDPNISTKPSVMATSSSKKPTKQAKKREQKKRGNKKNKSRKKPPKT